MVLPQPIGQGPSRHRVGRLGQPVGELQAFLGRWNFRHDKIGGGQHFRKTASNLFASSRRRAPDGHIGGGSAAFFDAHDLDARLGEDLFAQVPKFAVESH